MELKKDETEQVGQTWRIYTDYRHSRVSVSSLLYALVFLVSRKNLTNQLSSHSNLIIQVQKKRKRKSELSFLCKIKYNPQQEAKYREPKQIKSTMNRGMRKSILKEKRIARKEKIFTEKRYNNLVSM
jgi:hypothetical protein